MEKVGIVQQSKSPWASPLVIVERGGKKRYCGNFRRLNAQTIPDRYPVPNIADCTSKLAGKRVFSKIDLVKAYHNIPVYPEHVPKTAVISPAGLYEYRRMPFGLKNAPSTWMRFITSIVGDLDFLFVYFDDILLFSESESEHFAQLRILFQRLNANGLVINYEKSEILRDFVDFLGFHISLNGLCPNNERIEFIKGMERPRTVASMRRALGIFSFYRRFVRDAALLMAPLYDTIKGSTGKQDRTPIRWTNELVNSFEQVRQAFIHFTLLHFIVNDCPFELICDASGVAIGGVLEQIVDGERHPIAFHSEKLKGAQLNWSTYDRELYAIYSSITAFEHLVQGTQLTLVTDHKPLLSVFTSKKRITLERRSRQVEYISQYTTSIRYVRGEENVVADAASRPEEFDVSVLSLADIRQAQAIDPETQERLNNGTLLRVCFNDDNVDVLCQQREGKNRIFVPPTLRAKVIDQLHKIAHPGSRGTIRLVEKSYIWPGIQKDIRRRVRACHDCQKSKIVRHTKSELGAYPPSDRFEKVHTDLIILPEVDGYKYAVSFIDRATRWIEVVPLRRTEAGDIADAFIDIWVSRHGVPHVLVSDRGPQFRARLFSEICAALGVDTVRTTAYNPKSNGIVERAQKTLKASLRCRGGNWLKDLPFVLLGMRAAIHESGISPAEFTYGRPLRLPGSFFVPSDELEQGTVSSYVAKLKQTLNGLRPNTFKPNRKAPVYIPKELRDCKKVYVRVDRVKLPLQAPYEGPFEVLERKPKFFKIRLAKEDDFINIDRLKPAFALKDEFVETVGPILRKPPFDVPLDLAPGGDGREKQKFITFILPDRVAPQPPPEPQPAQPAQPAQRPIRTSRLPARCCVLK